MVVGKDGLVTRIRISDSAPCSDPRYRFPNVLRIEPPFETLDGRRGHRDGDLEGTGSSGGGRSRQTATVTAKRTVDDDGAEHGAARSRRA